MFPGGYAILLGCARPGAKLVVVDPRQTPMARTADHHVALRPGTDAAFFNGLLHVIEREGLINEGFISARTVGWEDVRVVLPAYAPERVAQICGIRAAQIVEIARLWGRAERSMAFHARGIEHHIQGPWRTASR